MELIKRTKLLYQAGSSDKVYEVDLCLIRENLYAVNFRYGIRGKSLKEGSKTIQPVPLAEAQRIFDNLVASNLSKGYRDVSNESTIPSSPSSPVVTQTVTPTSIDRRNQVILNRLASRNSEKWPLERVIWRSGELKIKEATPLLISLVGTGEPLRDYCIAWALGWCGDKAAIPILKRLSQENSTADFVRRIAWEALLKLSDESEKEAMRSHKIEELPSKLRDLAKKGTSEAFSTALLEYLGSGDYRNFAVLDTIYQIDNEWVRPALLDILCQAPVKPNYFQRLRHIFKIAEYRHDAEVFGIFAYTFDKEPGTFDNPPIKKEYDPVKRRYISSKVRRYNRELQNPESKKAYSNQTREYLRRRMWRTLKQLGEEGDPDYIKLAVEILLQYSDRDAEEVRESTFTRWNRQRRINESFSKYWDKYASYLIFNHILYENSPRYIPPPQAWRCQDGYKPGDPEPKLREEAFPELWQQHPNELTQLLLASDCRPVHHFATKVLRNCKQFCQELEIEKVIQLLGSNYEVTAELAFDLAIDLYNSSQPNSDLVLAAADCILTKARSQAYKWIETQREYFFNQSSFIAGLVTSKQTDTRSFARRLLGASIISDTTARILIAQIIAVILALSPTQNETAREISETLFTSFSPQLRTLGFGVISDLIKHPMPEVQALGALILLNHQVAAADLPPDLIESLLASPYDSVRGIGVRIFGQLPDETLRSDRILIIAMAVNSSPDIRNGIRPIIKRLAADRTEFSIELAIDLIDLLSEPERYEGVHKDLVRLLKEDLPGWIYAIDKEKIMSLIRAKSSIAQELGGFSLKENSVRFVGEFEIDEIVKLANHEILAVREAARTIFTLNLQRIRSNREEMRSAVKLLESKWDDSREFALSVFSQFTSEDWTPEVMVNLCDSNREDVRRFGRDLVTCNFQQSYGHEYLLKFSEHPSADMQMFATNFLENHGGNNPDLLLELMPYFVTVLSGVNRGRIAKQRLFKFLETEALKSELSAMVVAEILTRQSATIAIGDKAAAIQIMLKIKNKYPDLSLPIEVKEVVEVRS